MFLLKDTTRYFCFADFDPSRGLVKKHYWFDKKRASGSIDGQFEQMWQGTMALYKADGAQYFYVYGRIFELDEDTSVEVSHPEERCPFWRKKRSLRVLRRGQVVFETYYRPRGLGMIPGDPTPFVEEEHFDFGLWVSSVSKDAERKAVGMRVYGVERKERIDA